MQGRLHVWHFSWRGAKASVTLKCNRGLNLLSRSHWKYGGWDWAHHVQSTLWYGPQQQQQHFTCACFPFPSLRLLVSQILFLSLAPSPLFSFPPCFSSVHPPLPPSSSALCDFQNIPESWTELAWNGISKRDNFHDKISHSSSLCSVKANISFQKRRVRVLLLPFSPLLHLNRKPFYILL